MSIDPELLAVWTQGWALTRGASSPIRDDGGWRVEVGQPDQVRRFVFGEAGPAVTRRADLIHAPLVLLKVCDSEARVRALLDARWRVERTGYVMRLDQAMAAAPRPAGYVGVLTTEAEVTHCHLHSASGASAARGRAVRIGDAVIFDRIAVEPDHRRRGLGRAVMLSLQQALAGRKTWTGLLVATDEGRALYGTLGWRVLSDYVTAQIAD